MYSDLFTVSRDQVVELCKLMIDENINIKWTSNSRVDYVDDEMLQLMGQSGCRLISWGIESEMSKFCARTQGAYQNAEQALCWARRLAS
jgi:radical SAM superfamily enzyme YgiQ (UPF0313 family)